MPCVVIASKDESCIRLLGLGIDSLGWRLLVARNDAEILDRIAEDCPDFVILDLEATETKPAVIVSAVHHIRSSLRVIALTGHSTLQDAAVIEQGVFYYASKAATDEVIELMKESSTHMNP